MRWKPPDGRILDGATGRTRAAGTHFEARTGDECNVRAQQRDRDSLLHSFEGLIHVLRECSEIGAGRPSVVDIPLPRSVLAHRFDAAEGSILLLHNLADTSVVLDLTAADVSKNAYEVFGDPLFEPVPAACRVRPQWLGCRWSGFAAATDLRTRQSTARPGSVGVVGETCPRSAVRAVAAM